MPPLRPSISPEEVRKTRKVLGIEVWNKELRASPEDCRSHDRRHDRWCGVCGTIPHGLRLWILSNNRLLHRFPYQMVVKFPITQEIVRPIQMVIASVFGRLNGRNDNTSEACHFQMHPPVLAPAQGRPAQGTMML